jgi:hypothetical protein
MKPTMILLALVTATTLLFAQDPNQPKPDRSFGYFNRTEAAVAFGVGNFKTDVVNGIRKSVRNDELIVQFQTINGITYKGRTGLGVGIGVEKWQHGLFFPIFGQFYYDFKPKDNTFFLTLNLGKSIGTRDSTSFYQKATGGFMAQIGVGYKMKIAKRLRFYYELFYKYQAVYSAYNHYVITDSTTFSSSTDYKIPLSFVGFRIGISFY